MCRAKHFFFLLFLMGFVFACWKVPHWHVSICLQGFMILMLYSDLNHARHTEVDLWEVICRFPFSCHPHDEAHVRDCSAPSE